MHTVYSYTDEQALEDGVFVDVTPESMKGKCSVVCTPSVKMEFSMAAIMEMFNGFVGKFNDPMKNTRKGQDFACIEKMNSKSVWVHSFVLRGKPAVKMYFPEEA